MKKIMTMFKYGLVICLLVLLCNSICLAQDSAEVEIWYGNPDGSPLVVSIGQIIHLDVYARCRPDVFIADLRLNLGINNLYIDRLLSRNFGHFYSTILEWDYYCFMQPASSPPNPPGWSAETFYGIADAGGPPNPWLHPIYPTKILTMVVRLKDDSSLCGQTISAFGPGLDQYGWPSQASDTVGGPGYPITEYFSPLIIKSRCDYVLGDINGDGHPIGGDVTYAVRYFKSQGPPPIDSCYMDSTGSWFYPAGDVNGNCEFRGSDVTRMVAYFKSTASLSYCHFFPPLNSGK